MKLGDVLIPLACAALPVLLGGLWWHYHDSLQPVDSLPRPRWMDESPPPLSSLPDFAQQAPSLEPLRTTPPPPPPLNAGPALERSPVFATAPRITDFSLPRRPRRTGDLEAILQSGELRILVPTCRTRYRLDGPPIDGLTREYAEDLAAYLGRRFRVEHLAVVFVPVAPEAGGAALEGGYGDLALGTFPDLEWSPEPRSWLRADAYPRAALVIASRQAPQIASTEDFSRRAITVRESGLADELLSAHDDLRRLRGSPRLKIARMGTDVADEDLLAWVQMGITDFAVVDRALAEAWARILPNVILRYDLQFRDGWRAPAHTRRESGQLAAAVDDFARHGATPSLGRLGRGLQPRILESLRWAPPGGVPFRWDFQGSAEIFLRQARRYRIDHRLLVAQAFTESALNPKARSRKGAVGLMQVLPSTAEAPPLNIRGDLEDPETNVQAGAKYLRHLLDDYFNQPLLHPIDRLAFAYAGYNAGPGRILRLRKQAEREGYDPDIWFGQVEKVVRREVGGEPVDYVRRIFGRYLDYEANAPAPTPLLRQWIERRINPQPNR